MAPHDGIDTSDRGVPLFAATPKVYPKSVHGPMRRLKWSILAFCLAVYYIVPWLRWDRGPGLPSQAVLVDLGTERAYLFGLEIWPQDVTYFAGVLIIAAIALFFANSLFGRLWCGYACPQTVWTDLYLWVERLFEGDRVQRMRLDQQPLSARKAAKKSLKHLVWFAIAFATGGAWVMYFNDAPTVVREIFTLDASPIVYAFVGLFTATTYLLAGWARDQLCTYMCPWPRIQSAMIDEETLTVTYRAWRGEPRGKLQKAPAAERRGDCVDCRACVAVCPMGIDIRDGLQLECIGCGLCVDACDDIMAKLGRPQALIGWDSHANVRARRHGASLRPRLLQPRTALYATVIAAAAVVVVWGLWSRADLGLTVLADRNPLFVKLADGSIRNGYTLKISNRRWEKRTLTLSAEALPGARIDVAGPDAHEPAPDGAIAIEAKPDTVTAYKVFLRAPASSVHGEAPFHIILQDAATGERAQYETSFRGPS
jgi:cytochrome c oxidase accessory protein FixG